MNKADLDAIADATAKTVVRVLQQHGIAEPLCPDICRALLSIHRPSNMGAYVTYDIFEMARYALHHDTKYRLSSTVDVRNDDEAITLITRMADYLGKSEAIALLNRIVDWLGDGALDAEAYLEKHHARRASPVPDSGHEASQVGNVVTEELLSIHGDGNCRACNKPKAGPGGMTCSYPHGMIPVGPVTPDHPEGFWKWQTPTSGISRPDSGPGACQAGNPGGDSGERPARSLDSLK